MTAGLERASRPGRRTPPTGARPAPGHETPGRAARVVLALLGVYRAAVSSSRPPACRYLPSCSAYATEAISVHGLTRGGWLAVRRLMRCHPFHRGGIDPVPARRNGPSAHHGRTGR